MTEVVILNSEPHIANGYLALYAGEDLAIELPNVVFRVNNTVTVTAFTFSSEFREPRGHRKRYVADADSAFPTAFFGGSSPDYAATADCWSYFRNFQFFSGEEASSAQGASVQATHED